MRVGLCLGFLDLESSSAVASLLSLSSMMLMLTLALLFSPRDGMFSLSMPFLGKKHTCFQKISTKMVSPLVQASHPNLTYKTKHIYLHSVSITEQNSFASNLEFRVYSWQSPVIDWSSAVTPEGQRESKVASPVQITTEDQGYYFFFNLISILLSFTKCYYPRQVFQHVFLN